MSRYRIRYSKDGPARFISHLDMLRTFERAVRRAGLPVSLTQGFNPHPRLSFGFPLPVGMSGLNEYVDVELDTAVPPAEIVSLLDKAMPPGFRVTGACPVDEKAPALMAEVDRSVYRVRTDPVKVPIGIDVVKNCIEDLVKSGEIIVVRRKKDGPQAEFDIRPGILGISVSKEDGCIILEMELMTGSSLNVRPEEVIGAMRERCGIFKEMGLEIVRTIITGRGGKDLFSPCSG
ncbi:MAG: TIGR03936 family radical SAM-associated protein [Bacillota bacterium]